MHNTATTMHSTRISSFCAAQSPTLVICRRTELCVPRQKKAGKAKEGDKATVRTAGEIDADMEMDDETFQGLMAED